jgi:hypothetical protein
MNSCSPYQTNPIRGIRATLARCIAVAVTCSAHCNAAAGAISEDPIELTIGSLKVSEACVDMNFRNFVRANRSTPSSDQIHVWMQGFVRRQILTAEAINEGYGLRPEVAAELRQMEEHMLTDADGPLYRMLLRESSKPCTPDEVYAKGETTYQMELMGVPKSAPAHAMVSQIIGNSASGEVARVVDQLRRSGQVESLQGPFVWPFEPEEAASDAIFNAPIGRWQSIDDCDATVMFRVASKGPTPRPPRARVEEALERMVRHYALRDLRHRRETELLVSRSFDFDWDAAEAIVANVRAAKPEAASELSSKMLGLPAERTLARVKGANELQVVTVGDLTQCYNSLFFRKIPEREIDIYDFVKDVLMFRCDLKEAHRLGIETRRDFVAQKDNYRKGLILNLYEIERVRPNLGVTNDAAANYYNSHRGDYEKPMCISGRIYFFDELASANEFAKEAKLDSRAKPSRLEILSEPIVTTPETNRPGSGPLVHLIFSPYHPRAVGPLPQEKSWIVWVYECTLQAVQIPFANVENEILLRLQRPLIDPYEEKLAQTLSVGLSVDNRISEDRLRMVSEREDPPI